jgi:ADP-ribose pyrophosphatase YjhB (NUDIX family)
MALFNIRVYGILIDSNNRILVSDEFIRGNFFTKFPGGGLELGEGTKDCLIREFKEETNLDVTIGEHIYTTDFFQISAFNNKDQIICIYYFVHTKEPIELITQPTPFNFQPHQIADKNGTCELLRWIDWKDISEDSVHLPIDKVVVKMLKEKL